MQLYKPSFPRSHLHIPRDCLAILITLGLVRYRATLSNGLKFHHYEEMLNCGESLLGEECVAEANSGRRLGGA